MIVDRRSFIGGLFAIVGYPLTQASSDTVGKPAPSKRVALVIGNYGYEKIGSLNSPGLDATAVAKAMRALGYEVTLKLNAKLKDMTNLVADFARTSSISNTSLFYYSGHGIQLEGKNYLIPVDAELEDPGEIPALTLPVEKIFNSGGTEDAVALFAFDACRNNPFLSAIRQSKEGKKLNLQEGLAPIQPNDYFLIGFATAANKTARDGPEHQLSPYAKSLVSFLSQKERSIQDIFASTVSSVCDLTSPALEASPGGQTLPCQRPEIYTSLGVVPLFLVDQPDARRERPDVLLLTNIQAADPEDPAVKKLLGQENSEFGFAYIWDDPTESSGLAKITPDLEYFTTEKERGRPYILANNVGYYAPEEGVTAWSLSYPILDIIARRLTTDKVTISKIAFESRNSRVDNTPYIDLLVENTEIASLTLVNQSSLPIKRARIEFESVGVKDIRDNDVRELVDQIKDRPLKHAVAVAPFKEYRKISLVEVIRVDLPDMKMYEFLAQNLVNIDDKGNYRISSQRPVSGRLPQPPGFIEWHKKNKETLKIDDGVPFWIVGRIYVTGQDESKAVVDFAARLDLLLLGVGGGIINYDLHETVALPIDGKPHRIEKSINKTLSKNTQTFRGLFPLVTERSSFHQVRFSLLDPSGKALMTSPWAETHIVVSQNDRKVVTAMAKL